MKIRLCSLFWLFAVTYAGFAADEIHWTVTGSNSVTFNWRGTSMENIIRYGTAPGSYTQAVVAVTPTPQLFSSSRSFWEANLNNLIEDTLYHYAIGEGPDQTFRTPPPTVGNQATSDPVTGDMVNNSTSTLVTDPTLIFTVPLTSKPVYLVPTTDPTFKTTISRIAGDAGTTFTFTAVGTGSWGTVVRHHYMDDQPWNSDGTLLLLQNEGSPNEVILDGNTYQPKYRKCSSYSGHKRTDRWLQGGNHPHERMNVKGPTLEWFQGSTLEWFDVVACWQTRQWTLPFAATADYEMGPSQDGRFVALGDDTRVFVVDMDPQPPFVSYANGNRRIGPAFDLGNCGLADCSVSSVSISPTGKFVVVRYKSDHNRILDVDPNTLALSSHSTPQTAPQCSGHNPALGYIFDLGHPDMGLNPFDNNEEVIVGQRRSWCTSVNGVTLGHVVMVRLRDGQVTSLTKPNKEAFAYHISLRSFDRPGWAYVSYYPGSGQRFNDEIIAIKLDGSQTVERLAHTHTDTTNCYPCESHPVPSRDGRRVLFASDWSLNCGSACGAHGDVKAYVITYP